MYLDRLVPCAFLSVPSEGQNSAPSSSQQPALCIYSVSRLVSGIKKKRLFIIIAFLKFVGVFT